MKVDIQIKDNRGYCDVVYLVDRDDFQQDLEIAKNKFFTKNSIVPSRENRIWRGKLYNICDPIISNKARIDSEKAEAKLLDLDYIHSLTLKQKQGLVKKLFDAERKINLYNDFDFTVMDLRKKYRRHKYFEKIIESAIAFGNILDTDYRPFEVKWIKPELEYPQFYDEVELSITVYPCTTVNDVKKAFQEASVKEMQHYSDFDLITPNEYFTKAKPMIKYHREAYWLKKLNPKMKYGEIANYFDEKQEKMANDERVVEKAIDTYGKWLNQ